MAKKRSINFYEYLRSALFYFILNFIFKIFIRQSMANRTESARKIKEKERELEVETKEAEQSLLDFRYTSWVGDKEYKKNEVQ